MSRQAENGLPEVVDGLAFARGGAAVAGLVPVAELPRLADVLASNAGCLHCRVSGSRDGEGNNWLTMEVSGQLGLTCQRCMKGLAFPVEIRARLLLVPPGQTWPDEELAEDGFDAIAAEKEMALLPLIEEEVLLALPIVPKHDACVAPAPVVEEHELSPFAVLAKMKKGV